MTTSLAPLSVEARLCTNCDGKGWVGPERGPDKKGHMHVDVCFPCRGRGR